MSTASQVNSGQHGAEPRSALVRIQRRLSSSPESTLKVLQGFTRDLPQVVTPCPTTQRWQTVRQQCRDTIEQLRERRKKREHHHIVDCLRCILRSSPTLSQSLEGELVRIAAHYFPPRSSLEVLVCDFGVNRAERHMINLGHIGSGIEFSMRCGDHILTIVSHAGKTDMGNGPMDVSHTDLPL